MSPGHQQATLWLELRKLPHTANYLAHLNAHHSSTCPYYIIRNIDAESYARLLNEFTYRASILYLCITTSYPREDNRS